MKEFRDLYYPSSQDNTVKGHFDMTRWDTLLKLEIWGFWLLQSSAGARPRHIGAAVGVVRERQKKEALFQCEGTPSGRRRQSPTFQIRAKKISLLMHRTPFTEKTQGSTCHSRSQHVYLLLT